MDLNKLFDEAKIKEAERISLEKQKQLELNNKCMKYAFDEFIKKLNQGYTSHTISLSNENTPCKLINGHNGHDIKKLLEHEYNRYNRLSFAKTSYWCIVIELLK
jgi:hypothetical protein